MELKLTGYVRITISLSDKEKTQWILKTFLLKLAISESGVLYDVMITFWYVYG